MAKKSSVISLTNSLKKYGIGHLLLRRSAEYGDEKIEVFSTLVVVISYWER